MTFVLSKLFWAVVQPANFLLLALVAGLAVRVRYPRAGRALIGFVLVACFAIASLPVGQLLSRPLEDRFPIPSLPPRIDGIVVAGGSLVPDVSAAHGAPALGDAAERITTAVALSRRYPGARIVYSGGSAEVVGRGETEGPWARVLLIDLGVDPERLTIEAGSRNTWENAVFTERLVRPRPGESWVLITSATHTPRAVGCFRMVGWDVIPYPVDYHTQEPMIWTGFDLRAGFDVTTAAVQEWIGLVAYRLLGRTPALFPGPNPDR
ncbi:MAG: hypothetical protein QOD06_751 [Candidatus Binatota bacterium]|nr:hypothetical protein [Candidatus Binatota bacterium]